MLDVTNPGFNEQLKSIDDLNDHQNDMGDEVESSVKMTLGDKESILTRAFLPEDVSPEVASVPISRALLASVNANKFWYGKESTTGKLKMAVSGPIINLRA